MAVITSTAQWHEERRNGIGASQASAILGLNPYMSNVDLWLEKTGRKSSPDISSNAHVQYGHAAEAPIRELFALDYPQYEVTYGGAFDLVRNDKHPFILATLDGRLKEKDTGRLGVLEIKTTEILRATQREKWQGKNGEACIPDNYFCQCLWQLIATGFDFVVLHAQLKRVYQSNDVRTERRSYFIERSEVQEDIDYLLKKGIEFWSYVERDVRPPTVLPNIF